MLPSTRTSVILLVLLSVETQAHNNGVGDSKEWHIKDLTRVIHPQGKIKIPQCESVGWV